MSVRKWNGRIVSTLGKTLREAYDFYGYRQIKSHLLKHTFKSKGLRDKVKEITCIHENINHTVKLHSSVGVLN